MNLPKFLEENSSKAKQKTTNKTDVRNKCVEMLQKIRGIDTNMAKNRYRQLMKIFRSEYNNNVPKKKLLGLYGQLVNELRILEDQQSKNFTICQPKQLSKLPQKSKSVPIKNKRPDRISAIQEKYNLTSLQKTKVAKNKKISKMDDENENIEKSTLEEKTSTNSNEKQITKKKVKKQQITKKKAKKKQITKEKAKKKQITKKKVKKKQITKKKVKKKIVSKTKVVKKKTKKKKVRN